MAPSSPLSAFPADGPTSTAARVRSGRDLFDVAQRALRRGRPPENPVIERVRRPSLDEFRRQCKRAVPILIDGLSDDWPARSTWTIPGLRARFADRPISVISTRQGLLHMDVDRGVAFTTMRFGDYLDVLERGERPDAYLVEPGSNWIPELADDVRVPEYCRDAPWRNTRFWLSAADTRAPLHRDLAENLFFQIVGRKRFLLYPPAAAPWLYSNPLRSALPNYSRFDPVHPDYDRFPLARTVQPIELVLEPGDALYLPTRWWHATRSLELSASFNFWWARGVLSVIVRAAEWVKRKRAIEIYGLESRVRAQARA